MFSSFNLLLLCQATLCVISVLGEPRTSNPLQRVLSILEPYKSKQAGCENNYFLDNPEFSNYTKAFDGTAAARTRFYLFTNQNPEDPELMHECGGSPPNNTKLNTSCPVFIMFPGFVSGLSHMAVYREIVLQKLACSCVNIIGVEWTWGNSFDLKTAVDNQNVVAGQVAIVVRKLKAEHGFTTEDFTCMGHSLGAHGCGLVGQEEAIYAIHGLDPAGIVYWEDMDLDKRLDACDATVVQVGHCNAGQCLVTPVTESMGTPPDRRSYFGVNFTCGTSDVWYNDGRNQDSCKKQIFQSLAKGDWLYAIVSLYPAACSHLQCLYYYKASICGEQSCNSVAERCKNPLEKGSPTEELNTPDTENPVSVEPLRSSLLDDPLVGDKICGEEGEDCAIVGANYCKCDQNGQRNFCLKTADSCPYCDEEMYRKTKGKFDESCPNKEDCDPDVKANTFKCRRKNDTQNEQQ